MTAAFILVFRDLIEYGLWGITTLGTDTSYGDHSIFLMVYGIIAILVSVFGIGFYLFNLRDAYKNGEKRDRGEKISTIREQYQKSDRQWISISDYVSRIFTTRVRRHLSNYICCLTGIYKLRFVSLTTC